MKNPLNNPLRFAGFVAAVGGLVAVYLGQRTDLFGWLFPAAAHPSLAFVFNKTIRFLLNDSFCLLLVWLIFGGGSYVRVAFIVFLFEFCVLLPLYFGLKLMLEGPGEISSPLLSQLHRLIVNPTLMILLMAGFYYQQTRRREEKQVNG